MSRIEVKVHTVEGRGSGVHTISSGTRIAGLLEEIDRNPETVVVKRNEKVVPEEEELEDGDEIEVIPVVSGG